MENQTSFDLNAAVQRWRAGLEKSSSFRKDNLDELESHVRDSAEALKAQGLTDEESFVIAIRRTGRQEQLAAEFAMINGSSVWLDRVLWLTIGWIASPDLLTVPGFTFAWLFYGQSEIHPRVPIFPSLMILAVLLIVGLKPTLLRKPLKSVFGWAACLLLLESAIRRSAPVIVPPLVAIVMISGWPLLRLGRIRKVVLLLAICCVWLALESASSVNTYSRGLPLGLLLQCLVGASLIVLIEFKRQRPKGVVQSAE